MQTNSTRPVRVRDNEKTLSIPSWSEVLTSSRDEEVPEGFQSIEEIVEQMRKDGKTLAMEYVRHKLAQAAKEGTIERTTVKWNGRRIPYYKIKAKA